MTPELWQRLKPLYNEALDLPEKNRAGFLEAMAAADTELARELRILLAAGKTQASSVPPDTVPLTLPSAEESFHSPFHDVARWLPRRSALLAPGTVLGNRFRIVRHLGSGGMGEVYEASDQHMADGRLALKVIRPAIAGNPAALARFTNEVRLARKVSGPNVCRIHELHLSEAGFEAQGAVFLTMELLEGVTLHEHIATIGPLPVPELRTVADQLCTALHCIHEAGIVHGDLKPRNVMLVPHGGGQRAVVMDFGLACVATEANKHADPDGFGSGVVAGTPGYMAPEQFEGCDLGPSTDIYALGLILYEMATGIQPYAAHTPLAAAIRRSKPPTHASTVRHDLPPAWDDAIARCLLYDPKARFPTAVALAAALRHSPKVVLRLGPERRLALPKTPMLAASAALLFALAAGLWQTFWRPRHRELAPDTAHWYALGMTALREGSYLKATRLLGMVTQRDPTYALAHAALADAWNELDFTENAQREMLLAAGPDEQRGFNDLERRYIDAVRTTLIRDYSAATEDYKVILASLPAEQQADGYVDLGRIYERAGNIPGTVAVYTAAAERNPDDPAPYLHLGILKSRLRETAAAERAFNRAEELYTAESDAEGLAEVAYQRAFAATEAGSLLTAKQLLDRSLALARQVPSAPLEVRSLAVLSTVAHNEHHDDEASRSAHQMMDLAREQKLEYWVTDGMIRLGVADMGNEDFTAAQPLLEQALARSEQNGHPRLQASANLTLASICDQQKRWDESLRFAQSALSYFQSYEFMNEADKAEMLILRAQRMKGNFAEALAAGSQLLSIANQTHSLSSVALAEELVGSLLLDLQRYPEALTHYDRALEVNTQMGRSAAYIDLHRANTLWRLGRYVEAEAALADVSPDAAKRIDLSSSILWMHAMISHSQGNLPATLHAASAAWARDTSLRSDPELNRAALLAQAQSGHLQQARAEADKLMQVWQRDGKASDAATGLLTRAELALLAGDHAAAEADALRAQQIFAAQNLPESTALSLLLAAEAAKQAGNLDDADRLSTKSAEVFRTMAQSWGAPAFRLYMSRPDRRQNLRTLAQLRGANPDGLDLATLQ